MIPTAAIQYYRDQWVKKLKQMKKQNKTAQDK
jgi:hypothetical protein